MLFQEDADVLIVAGQSKENSIIACPCNLERTEVDSNVYCAERMGEAWLEQGDRAAHHCCRRGEV